MKLEEADLTEKIISACFEVSNELGVGFLEKVYEKALAIALKDKGLTVKTQVPIDVYFRNQNIGNYCCDILVNGKVILEVKAMNNLLKEHQAQLLNYLRATGIKIGILINFGKPKLEWKRFVL